MQRAVFAEIAEFTTSVPKETNPRRKKMKKQLSATAATVILLAGLEFQAQTVTTYYQPTLYPKKKVDGSAMPEAVKVVHTWDGWFNNSFNKTLMLDQQLQIGGWGDSYTSPIRFDLTGLPATINNAFLYLWAIPSGAANPSQVSLWRIDTAWTPSTVGWGAFPYVSSSGYYWPVSTSVNAWRGYMITGWYSDWKSGVHSDNGLLIWPYNADGSQRFDKFASTRVTAPTDASSFSTRPILRLDFTPTLQLRMPLPGNHRWLVTTEIGGYDCKGTHDLAHDDLNYFSIDFSWKNLADTGASVYNTATDIPVLAAAEGRVIIPDNSGPQFPNGNYIIIDHDFDGLISTGFSSRYVHLKYAPKRANGVLLKTGDTVAQGDQIGIMGTTGQLADGTPTSTGLHLHFGVRFNNSGASSVPELTRVLMDGWLLKSFQTECSVTASGVPIDWVRYYRSGNRSY
jgi:murein DD-endopeptidase MepM/ murein hydrolase activator NlpD